MSQQSVVGLSYHETVQKLYTDMTRAECRLIIAKNAGLHKTLNSPFGKNDLNPLHAFVTGEYLVDPRYLDLRRTRPPRESSPEASDPEDLSMDVNEMRHELIEAVKDRLREEESYREIDAKALVYDPDARPNNPYNQRTLQRLARFFENHADQRIRS